MRRLSLLVLLCASGGLVLAADPVDVELAKLAAARQARAEAEKAVADLEAGLRKLYGEYRDKLTKAGVIEPGPGPKPPEPKPADVLRVKLKAAFDADTSADKKEQAKDLAALYREAAKLAGKPDVATAGELLARVKGAAAEMIGPDALKGVRAAVGGELSALFPADGPLSDGQRAKAAELFKKLAEILDALGA